MKTFSKSSGFTLVELLVVITLIGVLVGMVIGVGGNVRQKSAESRAKAEISAIELALERYKIDNGDYPDTDNNIPIPTSGNSYYTGAPASYQTAGEILFEQLCGRALFSDPVAAGATQYFEVKESQVKSSASASYLADPFGNAYGYVYDSDGSPKSYYNQVVPDIWSTAGDSTETITSSNEYVYLRWITNWGSR